MFTGNLPQSMLLYSEVTLLAFVMMIVIAVSGHNVRGTVTTRTRIFTASILCAAAANIFDFLWNIGITYTSAVPSGVMWIFDFFYFVLLGLSMYFWFIYTRIAIGGTIPSKKLRLLTAIPLLLLVLLLVATLFTGAAFYFDDAGIYHRGPLFYLQHIFSYGYVAAASLLCYMRAASKDNYASRAELTAMASFVVPQIVCVVLQICFQTIPVLAVGLVISYLLVYIEILKTMISRDELTDIPNRGEMLRHLEGEIKNVSAFESLFFLFMDIDNFKRLNDEFGHAEGDRAIKIMASALRQVGSEADGYGARYGGDEFAFVVKCMSEADVELVKTRISSLVATRGAEEKLPFELTVSIGHAKYNSSMGGIEELISTADAEMYRVKQIKKSQKPRA